MNTESVNNLSGVEFERLCAALVEKMGFVAETTRASGDGGIDIVAYSSQPLYKGKYIIQCKRYAGSVGEPIIRDLYGVVMSERANKGILMTTGKFTSAAVRFADGKPIELIDNGGLMALIGKYGVMSSAGKRYDDFPDVPDFGIVIWREPTFHANGTYEYKADGVAEDCISRYGRLLVDSGFHRSFEFAGVEYYSNNIHAVSISRDDTFGDKTIVVSVVDDPGEDRPEEAREDTGEAGSPFEMYPIYPDVPDFGALIDIEPANGSSGPLFFYNTEGHFFVDRFVSAYKEVLSQMGYILEWTDGKQCSYTNKNRRVMLGFLDSGFFVRIFDDPC